MSNIPVFKPLLEEEEKQASTEALDLGWLGPGSYVKEFEETLQTYLGAQDLHVLAVNTGTSAVHLGLLAMGLKPGDEIITPSFNNICVFQAIKAIGADIVFCDIDKNTLTIDPNKIEELITPKTKIINTLDYGCQLYDIEAINTIASQHNIRVLHDAAHAFGSDYNNKKIGSFSDVCTFSFDPAKTITTIDGGAVIVKSEEEARFIRHASMIGQQQDQKVLYQNQRSWFYDVEHIGFRYHLANLHAAIGIEQLKKMPTITETRRATCSRLNQAFENIDELTLPASDYNSITPFIYVVRVPKDKRDRFRDHLSQQGVDTGIHWQAGHNFSYLASSKKGDLSVTDTIVQEIVTLPLHSNMTEQEEITIINAVTSFFVNSEQKHTA